MSGELKVTSRGLSKSWEVNKKHVCAYTGGKVSLTKNEQYIVAQNSGDVSFLNLATGQITTSIQDGVDDSVKENFTCFAVHPNGREVVTASANMLLRHWVTKSLQPSRNDKDTDPKTTQPDTLHTNVNTFGSSVAWECKRTWRSSHTLPIISMAYDSSGTLVATGSNDQSCRIWDVPRGYCTHSFKGQGGNVTIVKFHPDSSRLQLFVGTDGSISQKCQLRAFDLGTRKTLATFTDHMSAITSIAFSENGGWTVCTGGRDKVLNFYDTRRWKLYKTVPVYESVETVATVPVDMLTNIGEDSKTILSNSSNDSMLVAVGGSKGHVRTFWFNVAGAHKNVKQHAARSAVTCVEYGKSSDLLLKAKVKSSEANEVDNEPSKQYGITSILCRTMEKQIISVTDEHFFLFWNAPDMPQTTMKKCKQIVGYNDEIIDLVFLPEPASTNGHSPLKQEANKIAMAANSDQLRIFDLKTFDCELLYGHTDIVLACDVSPDGLWLASVSKDQTLRLWDVSDENNIHCVGVGYGHAEAVGAITFGKRPSTYDVRSSYTTSYLFSGSKDKTIKSWSIGSFIRDQKKTAKLSSTLEASVENIDVRESKRAHEKDINSLAMSPNDALLASGSQDKTIILWNAKDLSQVATLRGHKRGIWCVEFSPVDKYCASASGDRTVKLWSISDFTCVKTFEGHMASVLRIRFMSNGMQMMSSGADGLVKLWTIKSGECDNTFDGHDDKVWALGLRSWVLDGDKEEDGMLTMHSQMVSGGGDSVLNVWQDTTIHEAEKEIKLREERVEKEQELNNFVAKKQYRKAIILTLELEFPYKLRVLLEELLLGEAPLAKITLRGKSILENKDIPNRRKGREIVSEIVRTFNEKRLLQWMKYIRQWNTNGRHSVLAQYCLSMVLQNFKPEKLMSISPEMKTIVEAILAYSDRHFKRIDKLVQQSYLLDHTIAAMSVLSAPNGIASTDVMTIDMSSSSSDSSSSDSSSSDSDGSSSDSSGSSDDESSGAEDSIRNNKRLATQPSTRSSKRLRN